MNWKTATDRQVREAAQTGDEGARTELELRGISPSKTRTQETNSLKRYKIRLGEDTPGDFFTVWMYGLTYKEAVQNALEQFPDATGVLGGELVDSGGARARDRELRERERAIRNAADTLADYLMGEGRTSEEARRVLLESVEDEVAGMIREASDQAAYERSLELKGFRL